MSVWLMHVIRLLYVLKLRDTYYDVALAATRDPRTGELAWEPVVCQVLRYTPAQIRRGWIRKWACSSKQKAIEA